MESECANTVVNLVLVWPAGRRSTAVSHWAAAVSRSSKKHAANDENRHV